MQDEAVKASATGRILLWRGASLWIGKAGEPVGSHAHHAVQIALPFTPDGVRFQIPPESWQNYDAAIVAAHQTHAFEARDQFMATIFVEPESLEGRVLQQEARQRGVYGIGPAVLKREASALAAAYERAAPDTELITLTREVIATLANSLVTTDAASTASLTAAPLSSLSSRSSRSPLSPIAPAASNPSAVKIARPIRSASGDPRVARAIELIRGRLGETISLSEIAAAVHLSPDRFRHLFLEETGVGLRPYVLWLRLEIALATYVAGNTLTDAAHAGGFADSAHLSRTFKKMFGIAPASVRPESQRK